MLTRFISVVSPLFLTAVSAAPAATCNEVQIFIAVGHGETYPGTQRSIAQLVCAKHSSCGTANIDYPSTASGAYCASVETGIKNGIAAITSYASSCPSAKIVLTGWSQVRAPDGLRENISNIAHSYLIETLLCTGRRRRW